MGCGASRDGTTRGAHAHTARHNGKRHYRSVANDRGVTSDDEPHAPPPQRRNTLNEAEMRAVLNSGDTQMTTPISPRKVSAEPTSHLPTEITIEVLHCNSEGELRSVSSGFHPPPSVSGTVAGDGETLQHHDSELLSTTGERQHWQSTPSFVSGPPLLPGLAQRVNSSHDSASAQARMLMLHPLRSPDHSESFISMNSNDGVETSSAIIDDDPLQPPAPSLFAKPVLLSSDVAHHAVYMSDGDDDDVLVDGATLMPDQASHNGPPAAKSGAMGLRLTVHTPRPAHKSDDAP